MLPNTHLTTDDDGTGTISIIDLEGKVYGPINSDHPYYAEIVEGALKDDTDVLALFDIAETIGGKFHGITERISVRNGKVYLDNVEINDAFTDQLLRFLDEDINDEGGNEAAWIGLANFYEKLQNNPVEHSRSTLYEWIEAHPQFSITLEGDVVAYKGLINGKSSQHGSAIVDGEFVEGPIPYKVGSTVEMPRDKVVHDPTHACDVGLHVATFAFAHSFSNHREVVSVIFNPRDVVSVPKGQGGQEKIRVCRLKVKEKVTEPYKKAFVLTPKQKAKKVAEKPQKAKTTQTKGKGKKTAQKAAGSPLDGNKNILRFVQSQVKKGTPTGDIIKGIEKAYKVKTTSASLRRYKIRNGLWPFRKR